MPYRDHRICPICGRERVKNISSHFSQVHGLESSARKPWLKLAKYQTMNTHLLSLTRKQSNHSSPVKQSCMSLQTMKKQKIQQGQEH